MCTVTESYFTKFLLVTNHFIIWSLKVFQYSILFNLAIHNSSFEMLCNVLFPRRGGGGRLEGLEGGWRVWIGNGRLLFMICFSQLDFFFFAWIRLALIAVVYSFGMSPTPLQKCSCLPLMATLLLSSFPLFRCGGEDTKETCSSVQTRYTKRKPRMWSKVLAAYAAMFGWGTVEQTNIQWHQNPAERDKQSKVSQ